MFVRRHWLSLLTLAALLVGPFAVAPRAAEAQTFDFTYIVDTIDDLDRASGCTTPVTEDEDCSLREAINEANADGGSSAIQFAASLNADPVNNPPIIALADPGNPLPPLTANDTTIDGVADPSGTETQIAIYGRGSEFNGLTITGSNIVVIGLSIYGFVCSNQNGGAIVIEGGQNNNITDSYIGLRLDGTEPDPAERNCNGVVIRADSSGNEIADNYIAANTFDGILIQDAINNIIQGNFIGLSPVTGQPISANLRNGIHLLTTAGQTTTGNLIGGTLSNERNFISGNGSNNTGSGIMLSGSGTRQNTIRSNYIGLRSSGSEARANSGDGVRIQSGARENSLIGTLAARLVISGNSGISTSGNGIRITGSGTISNTVSGVIVGTNSAFSAAIANSGQGILIDNGASGNTVSGNSTDRAIIAGNTGSGVVIRGNNTNNNRVLGATIGLAPSGVTSVAIPNGGGGVLVEGGASGTTVSGSTISGNGQFGLRLSGVTTTTVQGNFIGLNLARGAAIANSGPGVDVANSTNTLIGGDDTGFRNHIAGNSQPGVVIRGADTFSTTVDANVIGLACNTTTVATCNSDPARFTLAAPNGGGILVDDGAEQTTIGGAFGNTIAGNAADASGPAGIRVAGTATLTVSISLNTIGFLPNGSNPPLQRPHGAGILLDGAGVGQVEVLSNTIRYNRGDGVRVTGATTVTLGIDNTLSNNAGSGVFVGGGAAPVTVTQNILRANGVDGVRVEDVATRRVLITNNQMAANAGKGINLVGTTIYAGSGPDAVSGPNHDIDPPFDIRVTESGLISGFVYTSTVVAEDLLEPVSACVTCTIEVYAGDPTLPNPDGQGWERLGLEEGDVIVPDATGAFIAQLIGPIPEDLLLVAIDGYGNSSEFAQFVATAGLELTPLSPASATQPGAPGDTVTYTLRLDNTGSVDLSNIEISSAGTLPGWQLNRAPAGNLAVAAGGSALLTVTLTLPTGSAPGVRVPITDTTTLTATGRVPITVDPDGVVSDAETLTTPVLALPRIRVEPARGSGVARPEERITYSHRIFNEGNITVTVQLAASTLDAAQSGRIWPTELSIDEVTIPPGGFTDISLNVTVPASAQEGASATSYITATAVGYPSETRAFSDTTRVALQLRAEMFPDDTEPGAAGGEVTFFHTVRNLSNSPASFRLVYQSNFGSTVTFFSETPGIEIVNNTFLISNVFNPPASTNTMTLRAVVQVNGDLLPGDQEVITISLADPATGERIGGANVIDRINIQGVVGPPRPQLWLPMIFGDPGPQ